MRLANRRVGLVAVIAAIVALAACGSSSKSSSNSSNTSPPASNGGPSAANLTVDDFTVDFSAMNALKDMAAQGKGLIGVLLPDTTTSARYETFDRPYLTQAFQAAGLSSDQFKIDNAHGSDQTMQTQAEADITAAKRIDPNVAPSRNTSRQM